MSFPQRKTAVRKCSGTNKTTYIERLKYETAVLSSEMFRSSLVTNRMSGSQNGTICSAVIVLPAERSVLQPTVGACPTADKTLLHAASNWLLMTGLIQ